MTASLLAEFEHAFQMKHKDASGKKVLKFPNGTATVNEDSELFVGCFHPMKAFRHFAIDIHYGDSILNCSSRKISRECSSVNP